MNKQNSVAAQIVTLSQMPMADLWQLWDRHFDRRPDKTNRNYLHYQLAYKIQETAFGAIPPNAMRQLTNIGMRSSKVKGRKKSREIHLAAGTVLVREWGEREHKVTVTADGRFDYEGQMFKSRSAVARHIAGYPWSEPLFFGHGSKTAFLLNTVHTKVFTGFEPCPRNDDTPIKSMGCARFKILILKV